MKLIMEVHFSNLFKDNLIQLVNAFSWWLQPLFFLKMTLTEKEWVAVTHQGIAVQDTESFCFTVGCYRHILSSCADSHSHWKITWSRHTDSQMGKETSTAPKPSLTKLATGRVVQHWLPECGLANSSFSHSFRRCWNSPSWILSID